MTFNISDQVQFGVRQYWTGKGRPGIPCYKGTIVEINEKTVIVRSDQYSDGNLTFTLRKNGNFVLKGDADDNFRGFSRVALRLNGKPAPRSKPKITKAQECHQD